MTSKTSNFSILAEVQVDVSKVQKQLDKLSPNLTIGGANGSKSVNKTLKDVNKTVEDTSKSVDKANKSVQNSTITVNAANEILIHLRRTVRDVVDEVIKLDDSITEFKKVSDLTGIALDNYVNKLGEMGKVTARTR